MLVKFAGTGLQVTLDAGLRDEWFRIILDEDHLGSTKFEAGSGEADYILAEGLPAGEHTLELVKETYIGKNATLLGMEVTGPGLVSLPPEPSRRLEFYGDSNLAGYSLDHEENNGSSEYVGSHLGYAGIVARMFDASYHNIATSGETLGGMNGRYDQYHWYSDSPKWNHADYPADVVIVNLGANDVGKSVSTIRAAYHSLLDDLRAAHPTAHIVVFNSWGWSYDETANYTGEVVEERNDPNMSVEIFPWVFEQWHGCQYDHGGMALVLAEHLEAVMGWSPNPADVMSGFGRDGDVANGSFEETAPFGGYGWRYIEDGGHTRIADAKAAYDGEHYVQLAGGKTPAEFHQPNPAVNGSQVSATLMLRGGSKGDVAVVTIDFRDQEMWTSALASTTETFALTSSWEAYTLTVTGPEAPARPVFHTRLTVKATPGSTVDVDAISMTTVDP